MANILKINIYCIHYFIKVKQSWGKHMPKTDSTDSTSNWGTESNKDQQKPLGVFSFPEFLGGSSCRWTWERWGTNAVPRHHKSWYKVWACGPDFFSWLSYQGSYPWAWLNNTWTAIKTVWKETYIWQAQLFREVWGPSVTLSGEGHQFLKHPCPHHPPKGDWLQYTIMVTEEFVWCIESSSKGWCWDRHAKSDSIRQTSGRSTAERCQHLKFVRMDDERLGLI